MSILLGLLLGAGALLVASPWFWPRTSSARPTRPLSAPALDRLLAEAGFAARRRRAVVLSALALAAVAASAALLLTGVPVVAAVAALAAAGAPFAWLRSRARGLVRARRALWPDVCDLLVASVRAGVALPDAVAALAASAPAALRGAFASYARDVAASGHFDSAMARLKAVLSDPVADRLVEALRMARQVGGTELVPVLQALSQSIRADAAARAEAEARQSWVRAAAVLGVSAPWVILVLLSLRAEGAAAYASPGGVALVVFGAAASVLAFWLMSRLGRFPEPRRWFG
ncbi:MULTISPECIES: type II secretion system F family protein [Microbacterium]|uniref:type II secretion system F family protein n=1 Tax=Microbacterium TaxID=33882 RepID=UPI0010F62B7A|nr:type II secretion system F family protein [Microbacterium sp. 4NA327F11]MCK9916950.1 type II secretion system F family protein [Microbacteriaceae bacterium K1510]